MTKFFRVFFVVLSLVGLLSLNVSAAVIADSGSVFSQDDFSLQTRLSSVGSLPFEPVDFPDGFRGLGSSVPISENSIYRCCFEIPLRFPSPVSSFSFAVDASFLESYFYRELQGWVAHDTPSSTSPHDIEILDSSGNVISTSSSASFDFPSDSCTVRLYFQIARTTSTLRRGVGWKFNFTISSLTAGDVSFIDYVMHFPPVVLGVVSQVTAAIVDQPFLLMTTGILVLGAGCGILGRVLSRD